MSNRMKFGQVDPEAYKTMMLFEQYMEKTTLSPLLKELIKIRASQINGCSFCINMHTKDARKFGETEQRIYALSAWRETPFFTAEERAILALTEEVTLINHHVADGTYQQAATLLGDKYLAQVLMAIISINAWNRIGIATGMSPALV